METGPMNHKIAPSLICMDLLRAGEQVSILNTLAHSYHCDIADNHFAPMFGLPIEFIVRLREISTLSIDVHLMVNNVDAVLDRIISTGVNSITVHIESMQSNGFRLLRKIKDSGLRAGVAINPVTPINHLSHVIGILDKVTIMTVDPGMAGQRFIEQTVEKIGAIAELKRVGGFDWELEVDGGCNEKTFKYLSEYKIDRFVVGASGLFNLNPDLRVAWGLMKSYMEA
jgi:D-allulose-6-phosphate 3-epimerase